MLRSTADLENYAIRATDGTIGHVRDFYFDDESWIVRYLVVDTGTWLSSRNVLISAVAVGYPQWGEKILPISISKEQVRNSPDIDTRKPVSRQHEMRHLDYYGYPYYWGDGGLWDGGITPSIGAAMAYAQAEAARHRDDDPHLRSCHAVMGHRVQASDGDIGHVQEFLVDEETWAIQYMIVNTSTWLRGHQVLIASQWIERVSWRDSTVSVNLTRQQVQYAPPYGSPAQPSRKRKRELGIHDH